MSLRTVELLATVVIVVATVPIYLLPYRPAVELGRFYGRCAHHLWPLGRRVAMINLRRAFGWSRARARSAAREVLENLGQGLAEGIHFARRHPSGTRDWENDYRALDPELERRILDDPRPKVFVTAHFGSWEAAAMILARRFGSGGAAIVRRVDNPFLNALMRRLRLEHPDQWIEKRGGAAAAIKRLRRGDSVALLLDENAGPRGVFVEFFGRPASTQKTAAVLALVARAPVVVGVATSERDSGRLRYRLAMIEPDGYEPDTLTAAVTEILETWIREDPLQWRWVHWRWKHRPDGSVETYTRADLSRSFREED